MQPCKCTPVLANEIDLGRDLFAAAGRDLCQQVGATVERAEQPSRPLLPSAHQQATCKGAASTAFASRAAATFCAAQSRCASGSSSAQASVSAACSQQPENHSFGRHLTIRRGPLRFDSSLSDVNSQATAATVVPCWHWHGSPGPAHARGRYTGCAAVRELRAVSEVRIALRQRQHFRTVYKSSPPH